MPPVDASSTTTPNLWSTLPSTSVLASKRKETVQKGFSIVHHEPGDARLSHSAAGIYGESGDYVPLPIILLAGMNHHLRRLVSLKHCLVFSEACVILSSLLACACTI